MQMQTAHWQAPHWQALKDMTEREGFHEKLHDMKNPTLNMQIEYGSLT
jgi:hypothetical protein